MNQLRNTIVSRLAKIILKKEHKADSGVRIKTLRHFVPKEQLSYLLELASQSEEADFFNDKLRELSEIISTIPRPYRTEGQGKNAIVHLHYFAGNSDWYIIERDSSAEQRQSFGYAILHGDLINAEFGYIPINELVNSGIVELDLYWTPRTIAVVMDELNDRYGTLRRNGRLSDSIDNLLPEKDSRQKIKKFTPSHPLSDAPSTLRLNIVQKIAQLLFPVNTTSSKNSDTPKTYAPPSVFEGRTEIQKFAEIAGNDIKEEIHSRLSFELLELRAKIEALDEVPDTWEDTAAAWKKKVERERAKLADRRDAVRSQITRFGNNDLTQEDKEELKKEITAAFTAQHGVPTAEQQQGYIQQLEHQSFTEVVGLDYYPTPPDIALRVVEKANIQCGQRILEPSAGKGNIADIIKRKVGECATLDVVEYSPHNRKILELKGYNIVGDNFMDYAVVSKNPNGSANLDADIKYDRIVMNPPYMKGIDWVHVQRAFELLKPDGELVALVPAQSYIGLGREATEKRLFIESNEGAIEVISANDYNRQMEHTSLSIDIAIITMKRIVKEEYESDMEYAEVKNDGEYQVLPKTGELTPPDRKSKPADKGFVKPEIVTAQAHFVPKSDDVADYVSRIRAGREIVIYDPDEDQTNKIRLFEHQYFGINLACQSLDIKGGFLLADGTGAGKTIEMLMTAAYWYQHSGGKPVALFTIDKKVMQTSFMADAKKMGFPVPQYVPQEEVKPIFRSESYRGLYDDDAREMPEEAGELTYAQRVLGLGRKVNAEALPPVYYGDEKKFKLKNGINLFVYDALSDLEEQGVISAAYGRMVEMKELHKLNEQWWWGRVFSAGKERIKAGTFDDVLREHYEGGESLDTKEKKQSAWSRIVERVSMDDTKELQQKFADYMNIRPLPKLAEAGRRLVEANTQFEVTISRFLGEVINNTCLVIFDEAHLIKNLLQGNDKQAGRAYYAKFIHDACERVLFATATPCDRPQDILYLKRAGLFSDDEEYQRRMKMINVFYIPPKRNSEGKIVTNGRWVDKTRNSDDSSKAFANYQLAQLFDYSTRQGCMVRREIQYTNLEANFIDITVPHGVKKQLKAITDSLIKIDANGKSKIDKVVELKRHLELMEEYKIEETERITKREVMEGRSVIIFAEYVDTGGKAERADGTEKLGTVRILKNRLSKLFGEDAIGVLVGTRSEYEKYKRLENVKDFQQGTKRVIISTIGSGGTGINLDDQEGNAPRTIIIMTSPLSFIGVMQGIGRVVRANTKSRSRVFFMFAKTDHPDEKEKAISVESWLKNLIAYKFRTLQAAVKGEIGVIDPRAIERVEAGGEGAAAGEVEQAQEADIPPAQHTLYTKTVKKVDGKEMPTSLPLIVERFGDRYEHYCVIKGHTPQDLETWATANVHFIEKYGLVKNINKNWRRYNGPHYGAFFRHSDQKHWKESYDLWNALLNVVKPEEFKLMDSEIAAFEVGMTVIATTDILSANARKGAKGSITAVIPVVVGANKNGDITRYEYDVKWDGGGKSINTAAWQLSLPFTGRLPKYSAGEIWFAVGTNYYRYRRIISVITDDDDVRYLTGMDYNLSENSAIELSQGNIHYKDEEMTEEELTGWIESYNAYKFMTVAK